MAPDGTKTVLPFFMEYMAAASNSEGNINEKMMLASFNSVDFNGDGVVTVNEYYRATTP